MTPETIGRYQVTSLLGRGGFAVVYLANDPFVKRQVAIKVLPAQFTDTAAMRARFQQEAEIIAALEHPAIVPIYDYGDHAGQPFIVMRYMSGGSLAEKIQGGMLGLDNATKIIRRIGSALDRAHGKGIIHRDLKPGNILFDQYGEAYLSDFGIARLTEASLKLTGGGAIGTPAYMSPEQVYGDRPIDGRSDIYALGVILFEMLTGTIPYNADTPAKLMMKHILEPVPRILSVNPDLPQGCDSLLERAMAKEPEKRFSKATDFATAVTLLSPTLSPEQKTAAGPDLQEPAGQSQAAPSSPSPPPSSKHSIETVIETPTPQQLQQAVEPTRAAPEYASPEQKTAVTTAPTPQPEKAASDKKERPIWRNPIVLAGGGLLIALCLIAAGVLAISLLNRPDTAESPNENTRVETSSNNTDNNDNTSASAINSAPRATAAPTENLPEAEGVLSAGEVGSFQELARLGRGFLTGLAVNPDGTILAAGSGIGVWLYDIANLEPITLLEGHIAPVRAVAWSPDGHLLASASDDSSIKIWDVDSNQEIHMLTGHHGSVKTVVWSPDGHYLASGGEDNLVYIWDVESEEAIIALEGHGGPIRMVSWPHGDSDRIATASEDGTAVVWDVGSGEPVLSLPHETIVEGVLWSADDAHLYTGADDGMVRVWESSTGDAVAEWMAHEFGLITMALSPDGSRLVTTGNDGYLRLWEPETGFGLAEYGGENSGPVTPAWMPDNDSLAVGFDDNLLGIWRAGSPQATRSTHAHTGQVSSIAWNANGRGLISGHTGDDVTYFWNLETLEEVGMLPGFTGDGKSLSISADGTLLARPSVSIQVFDLSSGLRDEMTPIFAGSEDSYVNVAALSPDGERVAAINFNNFLRIWNLSDQQLLVEVEGAGADAMAWSPDGRLIASTATDEPAVVIWDSQTGDILQVIPIEDTDASITGLDWSPDGRFLASSDTGGRVYVWERDSWGLALTFQSRGTSLNSLDWSPDGRW
ncbi:MAG: protein kinase, partial [Candidatus Promineifilaceae bacterium]